MFKKGILKDSKETSKTYSKNKLIVGNLKMNMDAKEVASYLSDLEKIDGENVIICPTNIYAPYFLKRKFRVGLQNVFFRSSGAYTGEVSPKQASSLGINYTIIGHSERRSYFDETDVDINNKIKESLKYKLGVILCIGETLEEKNLLKTEKILKKQLTHDLKNITDLKNVVIAYEPVWSIGTNKTPTNKDIEKTVTYIKEIVKRTYKCNDIKVLYGGSVDENNIEELNKIDNLDGYLIGRASTDSAKFLKIIEVTLN